MKTLELLTFCCNTVHDDPTCMSDYSIGDSQKKNHLKKNVDLILISFAKAGCSMTLIKWDNLVRGIWLAASEKNRKTRSNKRSLLIEKWKTSKWIISCCWRQFGHFPDIHPPGLEWRQSSHHSQFSSRHMCSQSTRREQHTDYAEKRHCSVCWDEEVSPWMND